MRNDLKQYIQMMKESWKHLPQSKKSGIAIIAFYIILEAVIDDFKFLSVDWIARQIGISESYLSRCYKDFFRSSPYKHIVRRKIKVARELLLQHPDLSIDEIAAKLDYCDGNYFIKVFKREVEMTPHQFRLRYSRRKKRTRKGRASTKY